MLLNEFKLQTLSCYLIFYYRLQHIFTLETYYQHLFHTQDYLEDSILVTEAGESDLIDLMNHMLAQYPMLKLFSLPRTNQRRTTEVGMKGTSAQVKLAMEDLKAGITALGYPWVSL